MILNVKNLSHGFGDRAIFENVSFRLLKGEHIGLIGANGEGKSTFMNIITGKLMPDEGKVEWAKNVRVGYLDQHTVLEKGMTIRDVLKSAFSWLYEMEERMNTICDSMGDASEDELNAMMEELGVIQEMMDAHDFYILDSRIEEIGRALGLEEIGLERDVTELSGGQRTKVLLAKLLLEKPDILLLDEPTNYLDVEHITWLKRYLEEYENAFILISHDIPFLNSVVNLIYHMENKELNRYVELLKRGKQRLATLDNESIYELMSIKRGEKVTLSATLLFSPYPQAYFPQLCITAIVIPGRTIGSLGDMGERFSDNQRIEGTIPEMLDEALLFVKRNMRTKTIISPTTGRRTDRTDYPITAVREAIINALVHRDYSIHTEGMPIQLIMFEDRIEIHNPGGLYGRITIDQLGKIQPDTRNPVLASALETLGIIENRYSGIPTIRMEMEKYNLRQPEFLDERGSFIVKLYKESKNDYEDMSNDEETNNLIVFCKTPRTRKEICDYLGLNSVTYAIQTYVNPLVEAGVIKLSIPDKPKSPKQLYYSGEREK